MAINSIQSGINLAAMLQTARAGKSGGDADGDSDAGGAPSASQGSGLQNLLQTLSQLGSGNQTGTIDNLLQAMSQPASTSASASGQDLPAMLHDMIGSLIRNSNDGNSSAYDPAAQLAATSGNFVNVRS